MNCKECKWAEAFVNQSRVCGYLLQGGETVFIRDWKIRDSCPLEIPALSCPECGYIMDDLDEYVAHYEDLCPKCEQRYLKQYELKVVKIG